MSNAFARGNIKGGLEVLQENKKLTFVANRQYAMSLLLKDWSQSEAALEDKLILTIANKDVDALNKGAREAVINPAEISFKHGYATTVYKSQDTSFDDVYVYHNGFSTKNNAYVEMSRHVKDLHLYCNREATKDLNQLALQFAQVIDKGTSLNYKTLEDIREEEKELSLMASLKSWVKDKAQAIGDRFHQNDDYYVFEKDQQLSSVKIKEVITEIDIEFKQSVGAEDLFIYRTLKSDSPQKENVVGLHQGDERGLIRESALSLKEAQVPGRILAGMGIHNFKHYEPEPGEVAILAADNDVPIKPQQKLWKKQLPCSPTEVLTSL